MMSQDAQSQEMAILDSLSEDRREIFNHFKEIAVNLTNTESIDILEKFDWNLERAILNFMGFDDTPHRRSNIPTVDTAPPNQTIIQSHYSDVSWFTYGLKLLLFPITISYSLFFSFSKFIFSFFYNDPRTNVVDPVGDVKNYMDFFKKNYCPNNDDCMPPFFPGSYSQALKEAKQSIRFLIVYLHGDSHEDSHSFCRKTLCNQKFLDYIKNDIEFLFWACNVDSPEGYRVSRVLKENDYPFIGVIGLAASGYSSSNIMALIGRIEGSNTPDTLVSQLKTIINDHFGATYHARIEREEVRANAEIRKEQDMAYQMSLATDRAKKLERETKEKELQKIKEEEMAKERKDKNIKAAHRLRSQKWRKILCKYEVSEEPIKMSFKLPNSKRIQRTFSSLDSLKILYYTVLSEENCPRNFSIKSNFPQKEIDCRPSNESDVEDYIKYVETNTEPLTDEVSWRPSPSDPPSLKERGLDKPQILMVIDNDA